MHHLLGAHAARDPQRVGVRFSVWAPNADHVSVIGDFNEWRPEVTPLKPLPEFGVWSGFVPGVVPGVRYKYHIASQRDGYRVDKADPYARFAETRPATASIVWGPSAFRWRDADWMTRRRRIQSLDRPISVYELHLGSWMKPTDGRYHANYRELADALVPYVAELGFTHVELMPVTEHPYDPSWGYQCTGMFAPTSRFGTPDDFKYFVDRLHQSSIGVILDWVPGHFPRDRFGLEAFDGTCLYEHADPRQGAHPHWGTLVFNFARHEVRSFLLSSANFWADEYHIDGFRVDAVASMLYLDYGRQPGEWTPNEFGGKENLAAITFLRDFNHMMAAQHPGVLTIAEESTAWPGVTQPVASNGLGFSLKWNMGWMNDTLKYFRRDSVHRRWHQNDLTFSAMYAFSEQFVLPFSHDEMVHGKGTLLSRMPGDDWQRFANLRLLLSYQFMHPGKKLLFMGAELGLWDEWDERRPVPFELAGIAPHNGIRRLLTDLNRLYVGERALHELDGQSAGFRWIDCHDHEHSVLAFERRGRNDADRLVIVANFTPAVLDHYRVGVPGGGHFIELFNSDSSAYGGSNRGNLGRSECQSIGWHGCNHSIELVLPPLALIALRPAAA